MRNPFEYGGVVGTRAFCNREEEQRVADVCERAGRHPFYVQHLCHVLWERCEEGSAVVEEDVEKAVEVLLGRESYAYAALWESLTSNQRRFLRGLAGETPGAAEPCFSS